MTFTLYIEGGGDNRRLAAQFREGWTRFLEAAGLSGRMPRVVRGGSREQTFKQFTTEIARPMPETLPLLLVDSEVSVAAEHSVWEHLHAHDRWPGPPSAGDDDAFDTHLSVYFTVHSHDSICIGLRLGGWGAESAFVANTVQARGRRRR